MSVEEIENLETYKIQLQQVEAALISEPENEELKKLKLDLEEVIALTQDLVSPEGEEHSDGEGTSTASATADTDTTASSKAEGQLKWKVGERCMAAWSKNGNYHEAVIDGISEGKAAITFVGAEKKNYLWENKARLKVEWAAEKERRRKRSLKKAARLKNIEESKEAEKTKWKDFNKKAMHKSYKGVKKASSIFASPDATEGKVGVGTCGRSGAPMTKFPGQDKIARRGNAPLP